MIFFLVALASGAHRIVYFNASGIIVNHNYTAEFLEHKCRPCRDLISDIDAGVGDCLSRPHATSPLALATPRNYVFLSYGHLAFRSAVARHKMANSRQFS